MRRLTFAAACFTCVFAASAQADIGILGVTPRSAHRGDVITVTASGYLGTGRRDFPLVMIPAARAPRPASCMHGSAICAPAVYRSALNKPPFVLVASKWRIRRGFASVRFRVPRVRPGRYVLAIFCASCTRGPKGSVIVAERLALRIR